MTKIQKKKTTILLTGCLGQVGHSLYQVLAPHYDLITTDNAAEDQSHIPVHHRLDLRNMDSLVNLIREVKPQIIINPAAYTAVDKAETDLTLAMHLNATVPGTLAEECKRLDSTLVHFSTDYVFDGSGDNFRTEEEPKNPLNAYGRTKLAGEEAITAIGCHSVVLRTSWVFSHHGANFIKTILRLGQEREELRVVADQFGAPTSANFLANAVSHLLQNKIPQGIYHLCCSGVTTWHSFANAIFESAKHRGLNLRIKNVIPISSDEYKTPAIRPKNSRLNCQKFVEESHFSQVDWKIELEKTMALLM